jgi:lipoprotein-releasing system ATP-binding protein
MQGIKIQGLRKVYTKEGRDIEVLRGIDVEIPQGDMVSIVGKSGAGKSTFLHVLGTLDVPSQGNIYFDGLDVFALRARKLAAFRNKSVGFVFQFHHLMPEFTALENVALPSMINRRTKGQAERAAAALLERVGLADRVNHKPGELSGGEQQRVALARALVMQPRLLLADEPTGNLDQRTGQGIHELFQELNESMGITIVIVTHDPRLADIMPRRLEMVEGLLQERAPLEA